VLDDVRAHSEQLTGAAEQLSQAMLTSDRDGDGQVVAPSGIALIALDDRKL
jgi:hypothetical protein